MARKIVTVIWGDAHTDSDEQTYDEIVGAAHPSIIHTMGYVVYENEHGIVIAGEWLPATNGGDESFRNTTFIPKPWIIQKAVARKKSVKRPGVLNRTPGRLDSSSPVDDMADQSRMSRPVLPEAASEEVSGLPS